MSVRNFALALAAFAGLTTAAPAGDFDKYLPEKSQLYVHVNVPKLFTSPMVRKVVPMVFDKYGDQVGTLLAMAKQLNPQVPDVPEDQVKDAMKSLAKPETIAGAFDAAQKIVTDIVIAGKVEGDKPDMIFIVKCEFITAEAIEMLSGFAANAPQAKVDKIKKAKGTVYAVSVPQKPDDKAYFTVPEPGVLHIAMSEAMAEGSFAAAGKPTTKLAGLMAKRTKDDFIFAAGLDEAEKDFSTMTAALVIDKDIAGSMATEYKDADQAAEQAKSVQTKLDDMLGTVMGMLGDKAALLKPHLEKSKAKVDGKTVTGTLLIPSSAVEGLLKKES